MSDTTRLEVDGEKIKAAIQQGSPIEVKTYTLPHEMEVYITSILSSLLQELNHPEMIDYLSYCIRELMINAKKANTKRVFFQEKKLDLNDEDQYEIGMKNFKKETLSNIERYLEKQNELGLYIKTIFQIKDNCLYIDVRNNSKMTLAEYKRVHDKFSRAQQYTSVNEPITHVMDNSEGAGLGIIILVIMLRKIGLSEDGYCVYLDGDETVVKLTLPIAPVAHS